MTPTLRNWPNRRAVQKTNDANESLKIETTLIDTVAPRKQKHSRQFRRKLSPRKNQLSRARKPSQEASSDAFENDEPDKSSLTLRSALLVMAEQRAGEHETLVVEKNQRSDPPSQTTFDIVCPPNLEKKEVVLFTSHNF